jgi:hypothetical protein
VNGDGRVVKLSPATAWLSVALVKLADGLVKLSPTMA